MENSRLLLFLILFVSNRIRAQGAEGIYGYIQNGYKLGSTWSLISSPDGIFFSERLGGGYSVTIGLGWIFHENIGIEVSGSKIHGFNKQTGNFSIQSNGFHTAGSLILQTKINQITIYAKAGIVVGFPYSSTYQFSKSGIGNVSYQMTSNFMRGFNGSLGIATPISKSLNLIIEAEEISMQGVSVEAKLIYNTSSMTLPDRIQYSDNPSQQLGTAASFPLAYSCIGINVGVVYNF